MCNRFLFMPAIALVSFLAMVARSQGSDPPAAAATGNATSNQAEPLRSLDDHAFDSYITLGLLAQAWETLDASTFADVALQMAEGERILLRPHRAISAAAVFEVAAKLAAEHRDTTTLERLAKGADRLKDQSLATRIAAIQKIAGKSRAVAPATMVSVDSTTPEAFAVYSIWLNGIQAAKATGYKAGLDRIDETFPSLSVLSTSQREYVKQALAEARAEVSSKTPISAQNMAETLNRLSAESRAYRSTNGGTKKSTKTRSRVSQPPVTPPSASANGQAIRFKNHQRDVWGKIVQDISISGAGGSSGGPNIVPWAPGDENTPINIPQQVTGGGPQGYPGGADPQGPWMVNPPWAPPDDSGGEDTPASPPQGDSSGGFGDGSIIQVHPNNWTKIFR